MEAKRGKMSWGQRWSEARPTKTVLFWSCVASMVLTMIVGFSWGGWVTGGTARQTAETMARDAVVARLAPICVVQSGRDPANAVKLVALKEERVERALRGQTPRRVVEVGSDPAARHT